MKIVVADTETNDKVIDNVHSLWLHGGIDVKTGERYHFEPFRGAKERKEAEDWSRSVDLWIGHNFLSYDTRVLNKMIAPDLIDPRKVVDTYIVSRTLNYNQSIPKGCKGAHSLKAWGIRLGVHKGDFNEFDRWSPEMVTYWNGDLDTNLALYEYVKKYIWDPEWRRAFRVEHDIQWELDENKVYGFLFDKERAERILKDVLERKGELEREIQEDYPPTLQCVSTIQYRVKQDGELFKNVADAKEKYPMTQISGDMLDCYDYVPFNPGSPTQRIEKLWEAGWKPFDKTKTHQEFSRTKVGDRWRKTESMDQEFYDAKKAHFDYYGWTVSEDNLSTLPDDAPAAAGKLAQWLTLEGRRSSLVEWLGQVGPDGRIHGSTFGIGAWTGRMAHNNPNTANISSTWNPKKEAKTDVDKVKKRYDTAMRSCWMVPKDAIQVGTDMAGIQLRVLADYLARHFDARDYMDAIVAGRSEDETDIHNMNRRALGIEHVTRDDAKTFNYYWASSVK